MERPTLGDLSAFVAIARHRSFRKAADELGLVPSTLSHVMRALEKKLGVRLLNRTTRSVSPTDAGERLLAQLTPVMRDLDAALAAALDLGQPPRGTLRINASEVAARLLLAAIVPTFLARHPAMEVDLVTEGRLVDIVAAGFDAGVRLGEAVPRDMVAVRLGEPAQFLAVASPAYLEAHPAPRTPDDLAKHRCIRQRLPSGKIYRWEFARRGREVSVDVPGPLVLDHGELMTESAAAGLGIAFVPRLSAAPYLARGALVTVLEDWCPEIPGLFLYYPAGRLVPPGLRAFVDVVKELSSERRSPPAARRARRDPRR